MFGGLGNFAAIIVQKSNPELESIVKEFNDVVSTLNSKHSHQA